MKQISWYGHAISALGLLLVTVSAASAASPARDHAHAMTLDLVRDFDAAGDGKADDTAALQRFLDACAQGPSACTIPAGTYLHHGLILDTAVAAVGITITGAGAGATILKLAPGTTAHALTIRSTGGYGNQSRPRLSDLTVDGSETGGDGIHFELPPGLRSVNDYAQGADFRDVTIKFAGRDGVYVGPGVNAGQAFDLWVAHPGRNALTIDGGADWRFINSQFYGAERAGYAIAGVADSGSGAIRLRTASPHALSDGMTVAVWGTNGTTAPTGLWSARVVDSTHIDLPGSKMAGEWRNSGWIVPILPIAAVTDDGNHAIRIRTAAAHGLATGQQVFIRDVGGAPANGHWQVTVVDDHTVDLDGSRLTRPYTGGGSLRPATFGIAIRSPASNFFSDCTLYDNMIGLAQTSNSGNIFKFTGGEINSQRMGGVAIATRGMAVPDTLQNVQFASNSTVSSGAYSDILLMNTGATSIVGNQFVRSGPAERFLLEIQSAAAEPVWAANAYNQVAPFRPYAESVIGTDSPPPLAETRPLK